MAKKVNVTPLHDRVIVKAAAAEEKTAGGIIIPDTAKEKPQRGIVIAAGPGKKDEPVTVKTGDTVLYGKYAGTEIQIEGDDYLIMRESRYSGNCIMCKCRGCADSSMIGNSSFHINFQIFKLQIFKLNNYGKTNLLRC